VVEVVIPQDEVDRALQGGVHFHQGVSYRRSLRYVASDEDAVRSATAECAQKTLQSGVIEELQVDVVDPSGFHISCGQILDRKIIL
jgi:hypothetical protein